MMNCLEIGDKRILPCPDGFHVLDSEERKGIHFLGNAQGECLSDPERHTMISVGWKSIGGIFSLLLNAKDLAKRMESDIKKSMQRYGYRLGGFEEKRVSDKKAEGFCYEYEVQGVGMYGESCIVKDGRMLYYLNVYTRKENMDESLDVWNRILLSVKIR